MHRTPTTRRVVKLTRRSQSPDSGSFEGRRPSSQPHAWARFLRAYIAHGHDASERGPPASRATRRPRRWPQLRARGRIGSVEPRGRTPPNDDVAALGPFNFNNIRYSIQNIGSQGHEQDAARRTQLVMKFTASTKPVQRGLLGTLRACSRGYENLGITRNPAGITSGANSRDFCAPVVLNTNITKGQEIRIRRASSREETRSTSRWARR